MPRAGAGGEKALGRRRSRDTVGTDPGTGAQVESDPAETTGESQRGHHGAGEAREIPDRREVVQPGEREAGEEGEGSVRGSRIPGPRVRG